MPLKVAVVTPYHRESVEVLRQCHDSVAVQTHPCRHFLVADGFPQEQVRAWDAEHFALPRAHGDNGNTPRTIGSLSAVRLGYDAIAYLDADNWFRADHIAGMVELQARTGAVVCTAGRSIHRADGSLMFVDRSESDGIRFADTSCLFLTRPAFPLVHLWAAMPKELGPACDQVFWQAIRVRGIPRSHRPEPSVAFRTQYKVHYDFIGEPAPANAKTLEDAARPVRWWRALAAAERAQWELLLGTKLW